MTLVGYRHWVNAVAYSPDGRWLVSGSSDKTLKVWDTESGREQITLVGHTRTITSASFSPDGRWIVSASYDKTLKLWDASSGDEVRAYRM